MECAKLNMISYVHRIHFHGTLPYLQPAEIQVILKNLCVNLALNGFDFWQYWIYFSGYKMSVGCVYGSNSLYDCIIGRGLYTLTNIHPDVFLSVVKMPCTNFQVFTWHRHFIPESGAEMFEGLSLGHSKGHLHTFYQHLEKYNIYISESGAEMFEGLSLGHSKGHLHTFYQHLG